MSMVVGGMTSKATLCKSEKKCPLSATAHSFPNQTVNVSSMLYMFSNAIYLLVLVTYCCETNYSKTKWLKTTHIYYLTVSMGQELRSSLGHWGVSVSRLPSHYGQELHSQGLTQGGATFKFPHVAVGSFQKSHVQVQSRGPLCQAA